MIYSYDTPTVGNVLKTQYKEDKIVDKHNNL